jgi:hypothetical protein
MLGWKQSGNFHHPDLPEMVGSNRGRATFRTCRNVRAPFAGIVNYVIGTPPAVEGQPLGMVSRIAAPPQ